MQAFGIDPEFWRGRRVFLTGHTGFVGGWLAFWLSEMGAEIAGYALAPPTRPSFFQASGLERRVRTTLGDVRDASELAAAMARAQPEIVFHLAAQPLVRRAYDAPIETVATNVMGTANLMQAIRQQPDLRAAVIYTTDKVYENREAGRPFREDDRLGGRETYGGSKACAELVVDAFRDSYFDTSQTGIATVRAGNIIGGGDWATDRLVPDAIRAFAAGRPLVVRNPSAIRPWQHVLDPLRGTLRLAQALHDAPADHSGAWNFGPDPDGMRPVSELADALVRFWEDGACWQAETPHDGPYEAGCLTLDVEKAGSRLGVRALWPLERSLAAAVDWYKAHLGGRDIEAVTRDQIAVFAGAN